MNDAGARRMVGAPTRASRPWPLARDRAAEALSYEPEERGQVPGPATGDDAHAGRLRGVGTDDGPVIRGRRTQLVEVSEQQSAEHLVDEPLRTVDDLLREKPPVVRRGGPSCQPGGSPARS